MHCQYLIHVNCFASPKLKMKNLSNFPLPLKLTFLRLETRQCLGKQVKPSVSFAKNFSNTYD